MSLALILSFFQFCVTMAFTPGPNNMMLAVSGVNFGFKRTLGHMLGISFGFPVMFLAVGIGIGEIFTHFPKLYNVLKIVGFIYLLYLAWQIAQFNAPAKEESDIENTDVDDKIKRRDQPFTFWEAAGFQWVNPKAWTVMTISVTTYTSLQSDWSMLTQVLMLSLIAFIVTIPAVSVWTAFGAAIAPLLKQPKLRRIFNISMALLIVLSVVIAAIVTQN